MHICNFSRCVRNHQSPFCRDQMAWFYKHNIFLKSLLGIISAFERLSGLEKDTLELCYVFDRLRSIAIFQNISMFWKISRIFSYRLVLPMSHSDFSRQELSKSLPTTEFLPILLFLLFFSKYNLISKKIIFQR